MMAASWSATSEGRSRRLCLTLFRSIWKAEVVLSSSCSLLGMPWRVAQLIRHMFEMPQKSAWCALDKVPTG